MKIDLYTQTGEKKGQMEIPDEVFNREVNETLVHRALVRQLSNRRRPIAHVKTKGEVSGTGKKPYRQKHTGNARQGSLRNPHFIGGGVAHGPRKVRNFELDMPKKERRAALFSALSGKAKDQLIAALEKYEVGGTPKTKDFVTMLKNMKFEKKVLLVLPEKNDLVTRACRNIPRVKPLLVQYLNVGDILQYHHLLFLKEALPKVQDIFSL